MKMKVTERKHTFTISTKVNQCGKCGSMFINMEVDHLRYPLLREGLPRQAMYCPYCGGFADVVEYISY